MREHRREPRLVPFITARQGETAAPDNLYFAKSSSVARLLCYEDEIPRLDRDSKGVLWSRCRINPHDGRGMPTGTPEWKLVHPHRQQITMQWLHCQICNRPARTPLGWTFLTGPEDENPRQAPHLVNQPPVCRSHIRAAVKLCPHLGEDVYLAQTAPLYGVLGTIYRPDGAGAKPVSQPDHPIPYGDPILRATLGSQLVRRLSAFRVLTVDELMDQLDAAGNA
ncbi:hypothetical protein [Streptomyces sp. NPDC004629]|uniref:hypothetical protein n=1 Tax=Streptomyces sp. NPDC004629 TaxID=3364705 RepID=UPI0036AB3ED1